MGTPGQIGKLPKDRDATAELLVSAALQISPRNIKGLREKCLKKTTGLKKVGLKKQHFGKLKANMRKMIHNNKYAEEMMTGIVSLL